MVTAKYNISVMISPKHVMTRRDVVDEILGVLGSSGYERHFVEDVGHILCGKGKTVVIATVDRTMHYWTWSKGEARLVKIAGKTCDATRVLEVLVSMNGFANDMISLVHASGQPEARFYVDVGFCGILEPQSDKGATGYEREYKLIEETLSRNCRS